MVSRRQFLQTGTMAALAAPTAFDALAGSDDAAERPAGRLSIGYWAAAGDPAACGSILVHKRRGERKARLSHEVLAQGGPFRADVADAARLGAGDCGLSGGAIRLLVHGALLAKRGWIEPALEALALDVHFETGASCAAWSYRRSPAASFSPPVAMRVPVTSGGALRVALESRRGSLRAFGRDVASVPAGHARHEASLEAGDRPGVAKLRAGVYFFAPVRRGAAPPSWSDFQFRNVPAADGARVLVRRGLLGLETPDFDYVVLSIGPTDPSVSTRAV